jgi:hypothetical protein
MGNNGLTELRKVLRRKELPRALSKDAVFQRGSENN